MRFLALHGAIGNPNNFKVQLAPFVQQLEKEKSASFVFVQGEVPCDPPPGFEDYFGHGPHWRFFNDAGSAHKAMVERVRDFPEADTPEDCLRKLLPQGADRSPVTPDGWKPALDLLYRVIDQHEAKGEKIDGILGYSEGATVSATLLLDDQRRAEVEGRPRKLKGGVFFMGWPPLDTTNGDLVLSDESERMIDVPTVHICGAGDPYLNGAIALYNVCDEDSAVLFDHGMYWRCTTLA